MEFKAKRLTFRTLDVEDCGRCYADWLADADVNRFLETRHRHQSISDIIAFVEGVNSSPDEHLFGIFLERSSRHIGNIKVGPIGTVHPVADVSLFIGARDCWGQGYATEAIQSVSHFAFDNLGVRKLSASMYAPNQGSFRAFLKAGYRQEGVRRSHFMLNGVMCDMIELGALPEDIV